MARTDHRLPAALPRGRTGAGRAAAALALALGIALAAGAACSGGARSTAHSNRAVLVIRSPVADAVLWVDGRYLAQLRDLRGGVRLAPGTHQVEVRHDGYHAYYGEVTLAAGQRLELDVELAERFP